MNRREYILLVIGRTGLIVAPFMALVFSLLAAYLWYVLA